MDGVDIKRYTFLTDPKNYINAGRIDLLFAWVLYKPVTLTKLIIDFIRFKPKIVNLHFPDHQLFECYLLMHLFHFKLVISLHGDEVERMQKLKKSSIKYHFYNYLFKPAIYITGCSQYLIDQFHILFPHLNRNKCIIVHNGVNKKFGSEPLCIDKDDYIFTAARFVPKKGLELLIKATRQVTNKQLLIAGGDDNDFLNSGFKKMKDIILLGPIPQTEMAKFYTKSKLTVIPSKKEPYGIVVAEALCCGSPIVATNVGGIPEVITLAREKLNLMEKRIFDSWVKLVEPNVDSIQNGIDSILRNNSSIKDYLSLVTQFQSQFLWIKRLELFYRLLIKNL